MKCLDTNNLDIHQTDVPISIISILQVVGVHKYPVAPAWSAGDINENTLSEEATAEFGIREADIKVSCHWWRQGHVTAILTSDWSRARRPSPPSSASSMSSPATCSAAATTSPW